MENSIGRSWHIWNWFKCERRMACGWMARWPFPKVLNCMRGSPVDAAIVVHGTGSNFYTSSIGEGLAPKLLADGLAVLRINTRGHDVISNAATLQGRTADWLVAGKSRRLLPRFARLDGVSC